MIISPEAIKCAEIALRHEASIELRQSLTDDAWHDMAEAAVRAAAAVVSDQFVAELRGDLELIGLTQPDINCVEDAVRDLLTTPRA